MRLKSRDCKRPTPPESQLHTHRRLREPFNFPPPPPHCRPSLPSNAAARRHDPPPTAHRLDPSSPPSPCRRLAVVHRHVHRTRSNATNALECFRPPRTAAGGCERWSRRNEFFPDRENDIETKKLDRSADRQAADMVFRDTLIKKGIVGNEAAPQVQFTVL